MTAIEAARTGPESSGEATGSWLARRWSAAVSAASFRAFRLLFGLVVAGSLIRFVAKGWHVTLVGEPTFRFPWPGLAWLPRPTADGALTLALVGAVAGLCLALGRSPRVAAAVTALAFAWLKSSDLAFYLNHDVLVFLVLALFVVVRHPRRGAPLMPAWVLWLFRFQFAMVYLHAGIAKLQPDWLVRHEPLTTWLRAYGDWPVVGPMMSASWAPALMSWAGCLFDLCVIPLFAWRRTRLVAFIAVVGFHTLTGALFPIGIFPFVMIVGATLWLAPSWPQYLGIKTESGDLAVTHRPPGRTWQLVAGAWVALNLIVPQRGLLAGHDVIWSGQGYRFSWRVMVAEKTGHVFFDVVAPEAGRRWELNPASDLTALQYREMTTEPDMLLYYAHHLCAKWSRDTGQRVEVFADAWMSLNGRPMGRLVRPELDLCGVSPSASGADWLLPRP